MQENKSLLKYDPIMIRNARKDGKGFNIFLETLIFITIFIISSIIESVVVMIPLFKFILDNIKEGNLTGGFADRYAATMELMSDMPDWLMIAQLFAKGAPMIAIILYCRFIEKRNLSTMGLTKKKIVSEYLRGLLIGFILFGSSLLLGVITGSVKFNSVSFSLSYLPVLLLFLSGFIVQGAEEEVLCRGYFMVSASRKSPVIIGVIFNSTAFGLIHLLNPGFQVLALINIILYGVFMSVYILKRGNLWGACAVHSIWNYAQGNIFGLQVSGMNTSKSFLDFEAVQGKELLSGGSFGPEGGICVTIILTAAILIVAFGSKFMDAGQTEE